MCVNALSMTDAHPETISVFCPESQPLNIHFVLFVSVKNVPGFNLWTIYVVPNKDEVLIRRGDYVLHSQGNILLGIICICVNCDSPYIIFYKIYIRFIVSPINHENYLTEFFVEIDADYMRLHYSFTIDA